MSTKHRTPEPAHGVEYNLCDICKGEIVNEEPFAPEQFNDGYYRYDLHFHKECWDNAKSWVKECPGYFFEQDGVDGNFYGEAVEAVLNGKILLFIEGEESRVVICDDRKSLDETAGELDLHEESVDTVVVDGRCRAATIKVTVTLDDDED